MVKANKISQSRTRSHSPNAKDKLSSEDKKCRKRSKSKVLRVVRLDLLQGSKNNRTVNKKRSCQGLLENAHADTILEVMGTRMMMTKMKVTTTKGPTSEDESQEIVILACNLRTRSTMMKIRARVAQSPSKLISYCRGNLPWFTNVPIMLIMHRIRWRKSPWY